MLQRVAGRRRVRRPARGAVLIPDRCGPARHRGAQAGVRSGRSGAGSFRVLVDHASGHSWSYPTPPPEARFGSVPGRHRAGAASGSGASGERVSARRGGGTRGCWSGVRGAGCRSGVQARGAGRRVVGPRGPWEAREKKCSATLMWEGGGQQFQGCCSRTRRVK